MIISKLVSLRKNADLAQKQQKILSELDETLSELARLNGIYNLTTGELESERIIFQIKAEEIKYRYLCNLAIKNHIPVKINKRTNSR